MNITLNGKPCDTNAGNIISLLEEKNYRPELVAVEVNEDIIAKEGYRAYSLKEGDTVEIVTFMGGWEEMRKVFMDIGADLWQSWFDFPGSFLIRHRRQWYS